MKPKFLYPLWGCLYILCVCLGAITQRNLVVDIIFTVISLCFFIPPALLLFRAAKDNDQKTLRLLRLLSALSLGLTLLALVGSILSVLGPLLLGDILNMVLLLVSAPMLCGKYWFVSLFLWAMLLFASFPKLWKSPAPKA